MKQTVLGAAILWSVALAANAAEPCKSYYALGETVPAGCAKGLSTWNNGAPIAPAAHPDTLDPYERTFFKPKEQAPASSFPRGPAGH